MIDKLSTYDIMAIVLPGLLVVVVGFYGWFGWPYPEPGAAYLAGMVAASFLAGHLVAGLSRLLQPWLFCRLSAVPSSWGLVGDPRLGEPDLTQLLRGLGEDTTALDDESKRRRRLEVALARVRSDNRSNGHLQAMNSQIGFHRNASAGCAVSAIIVIAYSALGRAHLPGVLGATVLLVAAILLAIGLRHYWVLYGEELILLGRQRHPTPAAESSPSVGTS